MIGRGLLAATLALLAACAGPPRPLRIPTGVAVYVKRVSEAMLALPHRDWAPVFSTHEPTHFAPPLKGFAMFAPTVFATAHAPRRLRLLFDWRLHLGPAILSHGALGAGVGGRF